MNKNCKYPNCINCAESDCHMEQKDIAALLKRRRYQQNPALYQQKQQEYRKRVKDNLPHCDQCDECALVKKDKADGFRRLCICEMRLIEQKVSNSPQWCKKRKGEKRNGTENE